MELRADVAARLESLADDITDRWLDELQDRLGVPPSRLLPREELRDHVPAVLAGTGQAMRLPHDEASRPVGALDHLWLFAELRREQGYDVEEILREFDILSDIVFEEASGWLEETECTVSDACGVLCRLRKEMNRVGVVTVDTYQEEHLREKHEVSESLAEYARTLEHELADTLHAAMSALEILRRRGVEGESEDYVRIVEERLEHIEQMICDVRELATAEDARTEKAREPLREVIRRVLREVNKAAEEAGVTVEVEEPLPEIYVERSRLEIALMNLVQNAIKYADPDEQERWVRISAHQESREDAATEPEWRVVVADNGRGVPPEVGDRIFRRFVRAHPDEAHGTGLGLAIVKRVMEQRGGRVYFDSEEGKGSTFTLVIPPRLGAEEWQPSEVQR